MEKLPFVFNNLFNVPFIKIVLDRYLWFDLNHMFFLFVYMQKDLAAVSHHGDSCSCMLLPSSHSTLLFTLEAFYWLPQNAKNIFLVATVFVLDLWDAWTWKMNWFDLLDLQQGHFGLLDFHSNSNMVLTYELNMCDLILSLVNSDCIYTNSC